MDIRGLQAVLAQTGHYHGALDGIYGPMSGAAVLSAMTGGPGTTLGLNDYEQSAARLGCATSAIRAFATVESAGSGFSEGRPVILFEPHRFSKATKGRFDASAPDVSYPRWDAAKYPRKQAGRWGQLVKAVGLDVDAGFASASYGKFQILGENFRRCGFASPWAFAMAMAQDERAQLRAFEGFIITGGLISDLRAKRWVKLAKAYNGTRYHENRYDEKLADADKSFGGM